MRNKVKKVYDKYTVGNSPAAIYIIDLLNQTDNDINHKILKTLHKHRDTFNQLVKAYDNHHLSAQVVSAFITGARIMVEKEAEQYVANGYDPLIVNLFKNLVFADMKKFTRQKNKAEKLERSAIDRAKYILKNQNLTYADKQISTYGLDNEKQEKINIEVNFDYNGLPVTKYNKDLLTDSITNETLREKSEKRLKRLGKFPFN